MADTTVLSGLELTKWKEKFIQEYHRDSGFEPYMGASEMDIIQVVNDLKTDGFTIRVSLVAELEGSGVTGNQQLSGNEEQVDQYYKDISWAFQRNAVKTSKSERAKSAVDLLAVKRPLLKNWAAQKIKYDVIGEFHKIQGTAYASAAESTKDAWLAANADRVQFGAVVANHSTNDHSTSLANVDNGADKLTTTVAEMAKRRARLAQPRLKPFKSGTYGRDYFVCFCHPYCFRDVKNDTAMINANREARAREGSAMDNNPLFQDGDLLKDGIIYREIPEFYAARQGSGVNTQTHLAGVGAGGIDVGVNFLCGAQAIGYVNKQEATPTQLTDTDYGFFKGVGIELAYGMAKLEWANGAGTRKDFGVYTIYAAAVGDA